MQKHHWIALGLGILGACGRPAADVPDLPAEAPSNPNGPGQPASMKEPASGLHNGLEADYFEDLRTGEEQRRITCGRARGDRLSKWYCTGSAAPPIKSLDDLLVGLKIRNAGEAYPQRFAVNGHSSSLVGRRTSSVNPRVIFMSEGADYTAVGYVRGDQLAEIVSFDPARSSLNFFLLRYQAACGLQCGNVDRFGPATETNWTSVTIYGEEDIQNTPLDCLACHQPGGRGEPKILRFQEMAFPWTHWLRNVAGSTLLLNQFLGAHPEDERYAGIPVGRIEDSSPADLEGFVRGAGFNLQPNFFSGAEINGDDPNVSEPNQVYLDLYKKTLRGELIPFPYFGISPYDANKVQEVAARSRAVIGGRALAEMMPNMVDVFIDKARPYVGQTADPSLDAAGIVKHRCRICHDGRFPGPSRDNFRADAFPGRLSADVKSEIAKRIRLPSSSRWRMPPLMFSDLSEPQKRQIEDALAR